MIFVDSNIPMYIVGNQEAHKATAGAALELAVAGGDQLVTDAEVLQEIIHRYVAINRRQAIEPCTKVLLDAVRTVLPIELEDVRRASSIVRTSQLTSRDALHLAVMQRYGIDRILTFDHAFDGLPGIRRNPLPGVE